jgi:hypothetical protein
MSNLTLFENMPEEFKDLLAQLEPETNAAGGGGGGGINRLSIRGGVFRKVVNGQEVAELEERSLKAIIVKVAPLSRTYYAGTYTAGVTNPPTCWSADTKTGRPSPDIVASDRQSETCFDCPQNIKGSGQGDSRACRYGQRVLLLLANEVGEVVSNQVYQLQLPATSIFGDDKQKMGLQTYARLLNSSTPPAPMASLLTEFKFDTDSSTPKLYFRPVRVLTKEEIAITVETQKDPNTAALLEMKIVKKEDSNPQLTHDKVSSSSAKAGETAEETAEEEFEGLLGAFTGSSKEAVEEPKVKVSKKKQEQPKETTDLASLLDEFDD